MCDKTTFNCKLEIRGKNTFNGNYAGESGGAIKWEQVEPSYNKFGDIRFSKNFAEIYANDVAGIPAKIV
jgi:hypothetical protein